MACRYEALDGGKDFTVQKRLKWLRRDPDHYSPQPYDQLMACYRDAGEEPAARAVGLAKLQARRATLPPLGKLLGIIQDWTVGYGYRSWLALIWMAGFVAVGWAFFAIQPPLTTAKSPPFQPFLYSLDLFLPIVDLGQADSFNAVGTGTWVATSLVLAGWALTTALVAGFTRVINRS